MGVLGAVESNCMFSDTTCRFADEKCTVAACDVPSCELVVKTLASWKHDVFSSVISEGKPLRWDIGGLLLLCGFPSCVSKDG